MDQNILNNLYLTEQTIKSSIINDHNVNPVKISSFKKVFVSHTLKLIQLCSKGREKCQGTGLFVLST
jgi:hypothetical protein